MIGTPTEVCLAGRLVRPATGRPSCRERTGANAQHGRGAPLALTRWCLVPRALEYGTGERSQRTAVRRGIVAVVVCGT